MLIFLYIFSPSAPSGHLPHQREALDCTSNQQLYKSKFEDRILNYEFSILNSPFSIPYPPFSCLSSCIKYAIFLLQLAQKGRGKPPKNYRKSAKMDCDFSWGVL